MTHFVKHHEADDLPATGYTIKAEQPGPGGAFHEYEISYRNRAGSHKFVDLRFQNGTVDEEGINGLTMETLLAVVLDRLEGFQAGEFSNEYNETAKLGVGVALEALQARTAGRIARGVEGKIEK